MPYLPRSDILKNLLTWQYHNIYTVRTFCNHLRSDRLNEDLGEYLWGLALA